MIALANAVLARSLASRPLAPSDLAVIPAESRLAAALVYAAALAIVQTRYDTFGFITGKGKKSGPQDHVPNETELFSKDTSLNTHSQNSQCSP